MLSCSSADGLGTHLFESVDRGESEVSSPPRKFDDSAFNVIPDLRADMGIVDRKGSGEFLTSECAIWILQIKSKRRA